MTTYTLISDAERFYLVDLPALIAGIIAVVSWAYRHYRDRDVAQRFIYSIATNHLPHIYHTLGQICHKLGIEQEDPPQIDFVDFRKK